MFHNKEEKEIDNRDLKKNLNLRRNYPNSNLNIAQQGRKRNRSMDQKYCTTRQRKK